MNEKEKQCTARPVADESAKDFRRLSQWIHRYANSSAPRIDFLCKITQRMLEFSGCAAVELRWRAGLGTASSAGNAERDL